MKKARFWVFTLLMGVLLSGCETVNTSEVMEKGMQSVKGSIMYRQRIALPPNAEVSVTLEDVSLMDVQSKKVAEQTFITDGDQVPLDFELSYQAEEIDPKHRYSVRAVIRVDGKLQFTTDTVYQVITDEHQTKVVNLMLVAVP